MKNFHTKKTKQKQKKCFIRKLKLAKAKDKGNAKEKDKGNAKDYIVAIIIFTR
jgi:hypothetical protein